MKTFIIYHSKDLDGLVSGTIAKRWAVEQIHDTRLDNSIHMLGYDYGDDEEAIMNMIEKEVNGDSSIRHKFRVIMTDISFSDDNMESLKLAAEIKLIEFMWIDHHLTAMQKAESRGYDKLPGLRRLGDSATKLAWEFFFTGEFEPELVYWVDRYDVFKHSNDLGDVDEKGHTWSMCLRYQYGLRDLIQDPADPKFFENNDLALDTIADIRDAIEGKGGIYLEYVDKENQEAAKYAFPRMINGLMYACVNKPMADVNIGQYIKFPYDAFLFFRFNADKGYNKALCSLRRPSKSEVDILSLAKKYGGGGHPGACGFTIPWNFPL